MTDFSHGDLHILQRQLVCAGDIFVDIARICTDICVNTNALVIYFVLKIQWNFNFIRCDQVELVVLGFRAIRDMGVQHRQVASLCCY